MSIQIIQSSSNQTQTRYSGNVLVSAFDSPMSLDVFDINIIDLSSPEIWKNNSNDTVSVNIANDLKSVKTMVERKDISTVVFVLPRNISYKYNYGYPLGSFGDHTSKQYRDSIPLKDMIEDLCGKILYPNIIHSLERNALVYESTKTIIGDEEYSSDFYFDDSGSRIVLTESKKSKKPTTVYIEQEDCYITTLNITDSEILLNNFIKNIVSPQTAEPEPDWMQHIVFHDDNVLSENINQQNEIIQNAKSIIRTTQDKLEKNRRYKSILYTNGNELVEVVFDILQQLLSCDLSEFHDEKKEDFLIKKDTVTIIGEIKGITSNVKNDNLSQLENHFQQYQDLLEDEGRAENVHQVLIINPLRNRPVFEREPVHENQIKLAVRYGSLIIDTKTLLKLFERYLKDEISYEQCLSLFTQKTGLLTENDF